jgi:hypothetical protein
MSVNQTKQTQANQTSRQALPGEDTVKKPLSDENALVKLYREITQESE